jgi:membrane fusion protein (multidrug efflux system)
MKKLAIALVIVFILVGGFLLYKYVEFNRHFVSSNAVFVKSNSLTYLSFKLPGKIDKIYVKEGEKIEKNELLAKLDTKELKIKSNELNKSIEALSYKIKATISQKEKLQKDISDNLALIKANIKKLDRLIEAKAFEIDAIKYKLDKLRDDYKRFKKLYKEKKISYEKFESVKVAYFGLKDEIKAKEKVLESMMADKEALFVKLNLIKNQEKELKRLSDLIKSMEFEKKGLLQKQKLLLQNIKDSYLYAPFSGEVAKKFVNEKEVVGAGEKILAVVNLKDLYVLDLLEETKLKGIKVGCFAKVHIDALDKDVRGVVSDILPASAATFAILPRDISSGEFTKLPQRFYVKIKFINPPKGLLVGMSGEVDIRKCK